MESSPEVGAADAVSEPTKAVVARRLKRILRVIQADMQQDGGMPNGFVTASENQRKVGGGISAIRKGCQCGI